MTAEEQAKLVDAFNTPEIRQRRHDLTSNPETVVAHAPLNALLTLLRDDPGPTDSHFYYATTNAIDSQFAEAFRGGPNVTSHPIVPPAKDWSQDISFRDPDRNVVAMLHEAGRLGEIFSPYL